MKKWITLFAVMAVVFAGYAQKLRVLEGQPNSSDVYTITITDYTRLNSIICDVSASGETNSFTITAQTVPVSGTTNTYTYATAVADDIAGAEVTHFYNHDADSATGDTMWLKPGDKLLLTGNDATQTDYSNVYYRVVLEVAE